MANHAGSLMGIDPRGEVFLRTSVTDFADEVVTVDLESSRYQLNHAPTRNRRWDGVRRMLGGQ